MDGACRAITIILSNPKLRIMSQTHNPNIAVLNQQTGTHWSSFCSSNMPRFSPCLLNCYPLYWNTLNPDLCTSIYLAWGSQLKCHRLRSAGNVILLGLGDSYRSVFTLQKFIKLRTYDLCTFLYVCYTSTKKFTLQNKSPQGSLPWPPHAPYPLTPILALFIVFMALKLSQINLSMFVFTFYFLSPFLECKTMREQWQYPSCCMPYP